MCDEPFIQGGDLPLRLPRPLPEPLQLRRQACGQHSEADMFVKRILRLAKLLETGTLILRRSRSFALPASHQT